VTEKGEGRQERVREAKGSKKKEKRCQQRKVNKE